MPVVVKSGAGAVRAGGHAEVVLPARPGVRNLAGVPFFFLRDLEILEIQEGGKLTTLGLQPTVSSALQATCLNVPAEGGQGTRLFFSPLHLSLLFTFSSASRTSYPIGPGVIRWTRVRKEKPGSFSAEPKLSSHPSNSGPRIGDRAGGKPWRPRSGRKHPRRRAEAEMWRR